MVYDLIIVGSGPAGLSAAVYAQRAMLQTLVFEKGMMSGGQIVNTDEVDNYLGLPGINGFDLATKFKEHADKMEVRFVEETVESMVFKNKVKTLTTTDGRTYEAKAVIAATGANSRLLGVPGEKELSGRGMSYCAVCDAAFYRKKVVCVVGGGDVAVEDAIYLARGCEKVYLIHRRDELRAVKKLQQALFALENVEVIWDSVVEEIQGEDRVEGVLIHNIKSDETKILKVDGVFVAVGVQPNSQWLQNGMDTPVELDKGGYVIADESGKTSIPGLFAAGDVRAKTLRQIVTAVSDGANAVYSVEKYIIDNV